MGITTHGWTEVRQGEWPEDPLEADGWRALVNLGTMLQQGDTFFGSLFGVRNEAAFEPVAPDRGLPQPVSPIARLDYENAPSEDASWVSLGELRRVDWDAEPDLTAISSHRGWERAVRRTEKVDQRGRVVAKEVDAWELLPPEKLATLAAEREVTHEDYAYRVVPTKRREHAVFDWPTLWEWLDQLQSRWDLDPENVRLVVWFDLD